MMSRREIENQKLASQDNAAMGGAGDASKSAEEGISFHARVPQASSKDYLIRPKARISAAALSESGGKSKKMDGIVKRFKDKKMMSGKNKQHAMKMSIEGRKVKN